MRGVSYGEDQGRRMVRARGGNKGKERRREETAKEKGGGGGTLNRWGRREGVRRERKINTKGEGGISDLR